MTLNILNPRKAVRIVLTGFMGAGKSTIGPLLASRLGWDFCDTDHYLQRKTGKTIEELFAQLGEPEFRRMEAAVFAELHQQLELVLAVGGGAIESAETRSLMASSSDTCVIYLQAPLDVLIARCEGQPDAALRPILNQRESLRERFASRLPHYERAHITVNTAGADQNSVVDSIIHQLQQQPDAIQLREEEKIS
jgi:shikimate kinase